MRYLLLLTMVLFAATSDAYDKHYKRESEIPEPLVFDLVRRINSQKGELEINTLITHTDSSHIKGVHAAPEIEFAFGDGKAIELELPTANGKLETLKAALQFELPSWIGDITGTQIMHESFMEESINETTVLILSAKRLSQRWSTLAMIGNQFVYGSASSIKSKRWKELPIVNLNLFYDHSEEFDLGFETNLRGVGGSFEELLIMPQIHALLATDFKIQAGFGTSYDGYTFSPVSAFRLIKEFNDGL